MAHHHPEHRDIFPGLTVRHNLMLGIEATRRAGLLVEQKLSIAMRISHRVYVMGHGRVVFEGTPAELKARANSLKSESEGILFATES